MNVLLAKGTEVKNKTGIKYLVRGGTVVTSKDQEIDLVAIQDGMVYKTRAENLCYLKTGKSILADTEELKNFDPVKVIYNHPATVVYFADGTKEVVKVSEEDSDKFNKETGVYLCMMKKLLGKEQYDKTKKYLFDLLATQDKVSNTKTLEDLGFVRRDNVEDDSWFYTLEYTIPFDDELKIVVFVDTDGMFYCVWVEGNNGYVDYYDHNDSYGFEFIDFHNALNEEMKRNGWL